MTFEEVKKLSFRGIQQLSLADARAAAGDFNPAIKKLKPGPKELSGIFTALSKPRQGEEPRPFIIEYAPNHGVFVAFVGGMTTQRRFWGRGKTPEEALYKAYLSFWCGTPFQNPIAEAVGRQK